MKWCEQKALGVDRMNATNNNYLITIPGIQTITSAAR